MTIRASLRLWRLCNALVVQASLSYCALGCGIVIDVASGCPRMTLSLGLGPLSLTLESVYELPGYVIDQDEHDAWLHGDEEEHVDDDAG